MSMTLQMKQANATDIARYLRDGVDEDDLENGSGADVNFEVVGAGQSPDERQKAVPDDPLLAQVVLAQEYFARLANLHGGVSGAGVKRGNTPGLDLHKSWHMLHYLFTGTAWEGEAPAATLLLGGQEVGEDMGYGPARVLSTTDTAKFAEYLDGLDLEHLYERLDAAAMRALEIYCAPDDDDDVAELGDDLEHYFPRLRAFVADAAQKGNGLLIWME